MYRKLDANDDYSFGNGSADFLINTPETVGQAVLTALRLWLGEWFADTADGTPWLEDVLGKEGIFYYEATLRQRILGVQGVTGIASFNSAYDSNARNLQVFVVIDTVYGQTTVTTPSPSALIN